MKASELINQLRFVLDNYGDAQVYSNSGIFKVEDVKIILGIRENMTNVYKKNVEKIIIVTKE